MKNLIVLFLITFLTHNLYAQASPDEMVEKFFETYKKEGPSSAVNYIYGKNKWINLSSDDVIGLKNQIKSLTEDYVGKYYGHELLVEKKITDRFILKSYLVRYGRQPFRFIFQFYKPNDEWVFQGFSFDINLIEEVKEAAKLSNFRLN
jgi:hypothetical protein